MNKKVAIVICAVLGFSTMMALQSMMERHGSASALTSRPHWVTCKTEPTEAGRNLFGGNVYLTNETDETIKRNQFIQYTIGDRSGKFVLTEDIAPHVTVKQRATAYTGNPGCRAWFTE